MKYNKKINAICIHVYITIVVTVPPKSFLKLLLNITVFLFDLQIWQFGNLFLSLLKCL